MFLKFKVGDRSAVSVALWPHTCLHDADMCLQDRDNRDICMTWFLWTSFSYCDGVDIWEKVWEERFEVTDSAVCHSVSSSLQTQTSLRAIFHPQGILLVFAVMWLMVVIVQLHFTHFISWSGSFPKQTNNHAAILLLHIIVSCGASVASFPCFIHKHSSVRLVWRI